MQNYCKTIGALAAASALVAGNAKAEVEYEIHGGYTSEYIFRGLDVGDNLVEGGVDVAGEWNNVLMSAGMWTGAYQPQNQFGNQLDTEYDFYAEAGYDFGFMTGAVGYIYYWNLNSNAQYRIDGQEVYFSIAKDWGFMNSSFTYFWDVDGLDNDGYSFLGFDRGFEFNPCLTLQCATGVGFLFEKGKFSSWDSKVALDWGFTETATLSPFIALSVPFDTGSSVYNANATQGSEFYGGAMLSVRF